MIKRWQSLIEDDDWEEPITSNRRGWLERGDDQQQKIIIKETQWIFSKRWWWRRPTCTCIANCVNKLKGEGGQLNGSWAIEHEQTNTWKLLGLHKWCIAHD